MTDSEIETIRENRHTPCVGRCNTFHADVCYACGRTMVEKAAWMKLSGDEKDKVWARIIRQGWMPRTGLPD